MKIRGFSGGLNTRVDPSLIAENEAVIYSNIDNTSGILKSILEPAEQSEIVFGYFYNFSDTWLSSASERSYVEYKDVVYWTEDGKPPQKFDGSLTANMGIAGPLVKLTIAEQAVIAAPTTALTTTSQAPSGTGISNDAETFQYTYTYYDSLQKRESAPNTISVALNLTANKDVLLAGFVASVTTGVDFIRIYRIGDGVTAMTLVMEVPNAADNVTDSVITSDMIGTLQKTEVGISGAIETMQYSYTYYNSQNGIESVASPISGELIIAANKEVLVSAIVASTDIQVDLIRLYRIGDGVTTMTLVLEIPNANDNFIDGIATTSLNGTVQDVLENQVPIVGAKYLTEAYGIMFYAVGNILYFSVIGKPDYWPAANSIQFSRDITGIFPVPNGILVFSRGKADILVGNNSTNFAVLPVSSEQGCVSHYSTNLVRNVPTWVSLDGICTYVGGIITVTSKKKLGKLSLNIVNTAVYDENYYINLTDGTLLVMDTRFDLVFKKFDFFNKIDNILNYNDILYARQGDKLVKMFEGDEKREFDYLSPVFTESEHTQIKLYNNIYVRSNSDSFYGIEMVVYIDGTEVMKKNLKGDKIHDITPPAEKQRGSNIQFALKGIGTVYEIEYKVAGRQNGR